MNHIEIDANMTTTKPKAQQEMTTEEFLNHWELIINHEAFKLWNQYRPASCDWQDIAQEVRLILLERREYIMDRDYIASYVRTTIRNETLKAIQRGCQDELMLNTVHIEENPQTMNLFYSSSGGLSDGHID